MAAPLLEASVDIAARPEQVWAVVSDLRRMGEWSPQCRRQIVLGSGIRAGTWTVNINQRGPLVWPTTAKVVRFEPGREIAYRVTENGSIWSFTLDGRPDGVTLTERREVADGRTSALSRVMVDRVLGGEETFEAELRRGMDETLTKIKAAAEH